MTAIEFNSEFQRWNTVLLAFANRLTQNAEDARDLLQETAYRAFRNRDKFELGTNFRAWAITIMRNTFINQYRRKKSKKAINTEPIDDMLYTLENRCVGNSGEENITVAELNGLIADLGTTLSRPFMMHHTGYRYEEIAEELDIPIGTVKSRIFFARKKLKDYVEELY